MGKPKLKELDIVRAVAIIAVLLIHGTATSRVELSPGTRSHTFYFVVNNLSYFPVQAFILLSGLVLFYGYFDGWSLRRAPGFYRKRILYTGLPYVLWLFFYYLFGKWIDPTVPLQVKWPEFLRMIPWAESWSGYHLYFMIIILQMYALFPLLVTLARLWRPLGRYLWLFGVLVQAGFVVYRHEFNVEVDHLDRLFISYFALFCIGGSIGISYEAFVAWLNRNIWWVPAAAVAAGFVFTLFALLSEFSSIGLRWWEYDLLFTGYPVLVTFSVIWIGRHALDRLPRLYAALTSLGAASFGVYLTHPALLSFYSMHALVPPGHDGYHIAVWGGIILIMTVPWVLVRLLKSVKGSWILFGK
jgi:peptidoglycan/LPS O-acetylase OafA/YrhL